VIRTQKQLVSQVAARHPTGLSSGFAAAALLSFVAVGAAAWAGPLPRADAVFPPQDRREVELGRLLFYDPVLSGNREVACATCHHPAFGTGDGVSLGIGDGGSGLGSARRADPANPPEQRVPRNAPGLFNLGAAEFTVMFHDGRLEADASRPSGLRTPLEDAMAEGFSGVLSAQSMFPVLSPDEMAGHYDENAVARAVRQGFLSLPGGAWDLLSERVGAVPFYREAFDAIEPGRPVSFTAISDALAAFIAAEWRADDSAFDRHLRGAAPLVGAAARGMELFYGKAGCDACHSGQFQTDHGFHAIAMPQIGPGKSERFERHQRDTGRERVTGRAADAYAFRTPSLRHVARTAPYGHAGAYATLDAVIRHHLDPVASLRAYDRTQAVLPDLDVPAPDFAILDTPAEIDAIADASTLSSRTLSDTEIADIVAFLGALTDPAAERSRMGVPASVPSGLPVPMP
jgi:cytochrome c peroxidase